MDEVFYGMMTNGTGNMTSSICSDPSLCYDIVIDKDEAAAYPTSSVPTRTARPSTSSTFASPGIYLHLAAATVSTTRESWRRRQRISRTRPELDGGTA